MLRGQFEAICAKVEGDLDAIQEVALPVKKDFFFLQCRIAQSCGHVPARTSQKEVI